MFGRDESRHSLPDSNPFGSDSHAHEWRAHEVLAVLFAVADAGTGI
jgi:hypothetical protein